MQGLFFLLILAFGAFLNWYGKFEAECRERKRKETEKRLKELDEFVERYRKEHGDS